MVICSYALGQKYYPIPYNIKKVLLYLLLMIGIYALHTLLGHFIDNTYLNILWGVILFFVYSYFIIFRFEKNEFSKMPIIGKFIGR